jgi:hypothetical protein
VVVVAGPGSKKCAGVLPCPAAGQHNLTAPAMPRHAGLLLERAVLRGNVARQGGTLFLIAKSRQKHVSRVWFDACFFRLGLVVGGETEEGGKGKEDVYL